MAKETTIIFVYDTELLQREEDDPNSAILYFYPTWVSDQQKTALCGQLMGTIRCLKSIFSMPKVVSLQTGKFFIIENGPFILAVGSDRNISSWVLDHRANLFYCLVNFFHKDFVNLSLLYQKEALNAKLYHIFDTYLKLMMFGGNIFSQIPMLDIPKSGSTVFMEAVAFLDKCRDFPNALGGTILYHNKVVATHLSASTTKKIVLADPYRIKNPAEIAERNFELPFGVQLLQVYITNIEFCSLHETALRSRCILQHLYNKKSKRKEASYAGDVQEPSSSLKRDTSLLFTSVTEEEGDNSSKTASVTYRPNVQRRSRPNSLNLKSHNFDLNESKLNCKVTPATSYCSQASIANTPMTESKIFLHQEHIHGLDKKVLSVEDSLDQNDRTLKTEVCLRREETSRKQSGVTTESKGFKKLPSELTKAFFQSMHQTTSSSLVDLSQVLSSISKHTVQYSRFKNRPRRLQRSQTIHDPTYPGFRCDGLAASQYYFKEAPQCGCLTEDRILRRENGRVYPRARSREKEDLINEVKPQESSSKSHRKSLTLPLKPLNISDAHRVERKYSLGVQLTPLMNKLTILAFEEQAKAGRISNLHSTSELTFKRKDNKEEALQDDRELQKCVLFVCGQQDVVLGLLLLEDSSKDRESIEKLWELCTEHLPKLEKQINYCLRFVQSNTAPQSAEPYSFLSVDSEWDTMKRGGPWDTEDIGHLSRLHGDFKEHQDITDIILRNQESVLYGHRFESSQVFYHESAPVASGLLLPSDVLGLVQHKARKNLERDHHIVLS